MDDYVVTEKDARSRCYGYYANISYVDDLIGRLLGALEATGKLDNTVVVFTDHGDFLGGARPLQDVVPRNLQRMCCSSWQPNTSRRAEWPNR